MRPWLQVTWLPVPNTSNNVYFHMTSLPVTDIFKMVCSLTRGLGPYWEMDRERGRSCLALSLAGVRLGALGLHHCFLVMMCFTWYIVFTVHTCFSCHVCKTLHQSILLYCCCLSNCWTMWYLLLLMHIYYDMHSYQLLWSMVEKVFGGSLVNHVPVRPQSCSLGWFLNVGGQMVLEHISYPWCHEEQ